MGTKISSLENKNLNESEGNTASNCVSTDETKVIEIDLSDTQVRKKSDQVCDPKSEENVIDTELQCKNKEIGIVDNRKDQAAEVKINILSDILIYPLENSPHGIKRKREHLPSVLTSSQWLQIAEEKEKAKKKLLEDKENRIKKRAERKRVLEEKTLRIRKITQTRNTDKLLKKPKVKKRKLVEKVNCIEDQHNDQNGEREEIDENMICEDDLSDDSVPLVVPVGTYVVVQFENKFYPGIVTQIKNNQYMISTMEESASDWKWPTKKDEILYDWEEIKQIIACPTEKNNRGVFSVPEIKKYQSNAITII